jgi:alpha-L-fucosidase
MDRSFGFNRMSGAEDFMSRDDLLGSFVDIVAKGGNLLLNVGPRGEDAGIPDEQTERLDWLAAWSAAGGAVLAGTRPWVFQEGLTPEGHRLRYAARGAAVHVVVLDGPGGVLTLNHGEVVGPAGRALGVERDLAGALRVDVGALPGDDAWPLVFTLTAAFARSR